jgi:hypothetical protein
MKFGWRFGFILRFSYKELEWVPGKNKSSFQVEDEIVCLTQAGWNLSMPMILQ